MRIDEISISNYRQYRRITLQFPRTTDFDLHVIEARNGIGKTNILNAINWCLYHDEPHLGDKSKSLSILNITAATEAQAAGKTKEDVEVILLLENRGESIKIQRTVPVDVKNKYEYDGSFEVTIIRKNGNAETYCDEDAVEVIDRYLPNRIREYFFFDGEQLHTYFIKKDNTKIQKTIHAISQVDILTQIKDKLTSLIKKKEANPTHKSVGYDEINKEIDGLEKLIANDTATIADLKVQIETSEGIVQKLSELLRGQEELPELEKERDLYRNNLEKAENIEKPELISNGLEMVKKYKILLSFYTPAEKVLALIKEKEKKKELPPTIDKKLLSDMLLQHKCSICGHELSEEDEANINALINKISVSSATSHTLKEIEHKLEDVLADAQEYVVDRNLYFNRKHALEERIDEYKDKLEEIEEKLRGSDTEQIRKWAQERSDNEDLIRDNERKIGRFQANIATNTEKLNSKKEQRDRLREKEADNKRVSQLIKFAKEALSIVTEIESEMMNDVKNKIAKSTSEYFRELVWKKDTFKEVQLNSKYELDLIHNCGDSCLGSCSAAERALLALSFTLALHSVSGFDALLFIDTPVARVSDENRINFGKVLKEVSRGKQIIMTFAPNEYSKEIRDVFEPCASTSAKLATVDERETQVRGRC